MLLLTKSFKQKQLSKKLLYRFVKLFRIKNKINKQVYHLILLRIYCIYNIFYISLLKSYLHCADDLKIEIIMQVSKLIDIEH